MSVTLILGGARSGKSKCAEALVKTSAKASGKPVVYIATSPQMDDAVWQARVAKHREQRPSEWQTIEEPLLLSEVIAQQKDVCVMVDCLTLWLSNLVYAELDVGQQINALCETLQDCSCDVVLVSNEVGMGLVPETALGRTFRDAQGRINQQLAEISDSVAFIVAGLPIQMK